MTAQAILESFKPVVKMLAAQFGPHCEVVLHDHTGDYEHTIIAIENGHVTNRTIGGCGSNLGLSVLKGTQSAEGQFGYYTRLPDGRAIRSSTVYIKDERQEKVIGSLCVNLDVTDWLRIPELLGEYGFSMSQDVEPVNEVFAQDVGSLLERLIVECTAHIGKEPAFMSKGEKIEAVRYLDQRGTFLITKSSDRVARYLEISKNTLYAYLDTARMKENEK